MTEPDVSATLDALERKLRDLERELHGVAAAPAPEAPPVAPSRGEGLPELAAEIDELSGYRDRLARTQRELEDEYGRMLGRLEALAGAPEPAAPPPEPEPAEPAAPRVESWLVDAGPFADLAALGAFERELAAHGEVDVTGFEGRRAQIAFRPDGDVDLVAALPAATVEIEAPGRARVEL
jgi:hypothetical protein